MKLTHIIALLALSTLAGCAGLSVAYTRDVAGQSLTGFLAADGSYGILGKAATGKQPVKVNRQK